MTDRRAKPRPGLSHAASRRGSPITIGSPSANQVKGGAPPMALRASPTSLSSPERSILAPLGGKEIVSGASPGPEAAISGRLSGRKRCSAGGRSEVLAKTTPSGGGGRGV